MIRNTSFDHGFRDFNSDSESSGLSESEQSRDSFIGKERPDKILLASNPEHRERVNKDSEHRLGLAMLVGEEHGLSKAIERHVEDYHHAGNEYLFGDSAVSQVLRNFLEKFKPTYKAKLISNALSHENPEVVKIARKIAPPVEVVSDDEGGPSSDDETSIET